MGHGTVCTVLHSLREFLRDEVIKTTECAQLLSPGFLSLTHCLFLAWQSSKLIFICALFSHSRANPTLAAE